MDTSCPFGPVVVDTTSYSEKQVKETVLTCQMLSFSTKYLKEDRKWCEGPNQINEFLTSVQTFPSLDEVVHMFLLLHFPYMSKCVFK